MDLIHTCLSNSTLKYPNQPFPEFLPTFQVPDIEESLSCILQPAVPLILRPSISYEKKKELMEVVDGRYGLRCLVFPPSCFIIHKAKRKSKRQCAPQDVAVLVVSPLEMIFFFCYQKTRSFKAFSYLSHKLFTFLPCVNDVTQ